MESELVLNYNNILFDLIKKHNYDEFKKVILENDNIDLNIRDSSNNYLIQYTILYNNKDLTALLINKGSKLDLIDADGRSLLFTPIKYNYIDLLELLLHFNRTYIGISLVDIQDNEGYAPIYYAILFDNIVAIDMLLKQSIEFNIKDKNGYTPFHTCIKTRNVEISKKLIEYSNINIQNNIGETPLHTACNNEDINIIKLLIQYNVDPNIEDFEKHITPLMYSVILGNVEITKLLLQKKVNYNIQDYNGNTALHYAAKENNCELVDVLVEKTNILLVNIEGETIAHILLKINNFDLEKLDKINFPNILQKSYVNIQNNNGVTVVHYLTKHNLWKHYKNILKTKKNNIYVKDKKNNRPIDYINDKDKVEFINMVSTSYLNILRQDKYKNTKWVNTWENLCKHKLSLSALKKDNPELVKKLKMDKVKLSDPDVCIDIIKHFIESRNVSLPLKINYNCISLPLDKNVNFITFTGITLDIIFGLIYLQQQYKNVSTLITDDIIKNKELDLYYNSLGIVKSYKVEYLNFEIIWAYQKLFFPTTFPNIITKINNSKTQRFLIMFVGIELDNGSHGNVLIYDKKVNEIERFEPNGSDYPYGFNYNPSLLDDLLEINFKKIFKGVKYIRPNEFIPKIGFQLLEYQERFKNKKIGDPGGFCAAWSIWYADMRIKYANIDRKDLIKQLIKKIKISNVSFKNMIRNYSENITKLRDTYLAKADIEINDWLNDEYSDVQLKNFHEELYMVIKSL
jgi:ankyrin repeat protein